MTDHKLKVRRAAVLGAGVMGAQIAAHLTAAGIPVDLFDLPSDEGDRNQLAEKGRQGLLKLKPAPLASKDLVEFIRPLNFADDLDKLADCDFIIEAVAERMDIKRDLYGKLAPHVRDDAIFASNTSGLSITELSKELPEKLRGRFCGVHFFNPPRYMHLVELIPHAGTDDNVLDLLEDFLTRNLGKGVVRCRDTANFIGNRVGMFTMLSVMHHADRLGLGFDTVDAMTGPAIGRPKSATFRLADVVGLDTMGNVINTMQAQLEDDPWHDWFKQPEWLQKLIEAGALGQKSGAGVFRKEGKSIRVFDPESGDYRDSDYSLPDDVQKVLAIKDAGEKLAELARCENAHTEFLWSIHRDLFHYCAYHLAEIADSAREVDLAIRWGYGWKLGPFEIWQSAGWQKMAELVQKDISDGKTGVDADLPEWVNQIEAVHTPEGSWAADQARYLPRPDLPVFQRQYQPVRLLGEKTDNGTTVHETDSIRLWTLQDDVLIASLKSKMAVIDNGVVEGLDEAVERAESNFEGLVIWQPKGPFSAGANLKAAAEAIQKGDFDSVHDLVAGFQAANLRLRYASVPTVAAVRGLALGGGLELAMHTATRVAHLESYMGLVEAGVGLVPAGGGLGTLAMQIVDDTKAGDTHPLLEKRYKQVAMGQVAGSAMEAREMGYLREHDRIVLHEHELLHAAHHEIRAMAAAGYRPPLAGRKFPAAGDVGIATLKMLLVNMLEGHFISEHDYEIGSRIATVLCGGEIDRGGQVDEEWIHRLEREHFLKLAAMDKTQERVAHMLKTGKPLRN
ncbi:MULTISPECIES: 3-hydroxyacyl-CoA dehydrogenase/enoyl-CoA hydratase family protein [unclassified Wenzhouxiangella]|uniref:3-hydroxyacyl-CoA dehydrogenase/enoyl-CoA hydratase family protein n=1 Tax=unclassified Wenzhouxiangella TaxID=2613841 RepID=UPI000E32C71F|nr:MULTISPECIES: 3-hydroxyacyl-CoA dehydrogenase NAD-binding domain-containing protein [unclassified Wenzhouxiangella]RFF26346.1 3-hydroxyacyl-CoA dehydrogenase/enoyl-CoA hydratase family protein [Wenzhouxiangella sp. 15181]RFP67382.1 3-hydroxyacyl-CoA dehydrogenase/enoyl-CoA hydratase family protein [Wenzhouxiangella sp. 15190]